MRSKLLIILLIIFAIPVFGTESKNRTANKFLIKSWLKLGPMKMTELELRNFKSAKAKSEQQYIDERALKPVNGKSVEWRRGVFYKWRETESISIGSVKNSVSYFAVYPDAFRRIKTGIIIENIGDNLIDIFLDGRSIKKNFNREKRSVKGELDLLNEKHILLIKIFSSDGKPATPAVYFKDAGQIKNGSIKLSLDLNRRVNFRNILNMTSVRKIDVSPDGKFVAVNLRKTDGTGKSQSWLEILDTRTRRTIFNSEHIGKISGFSWMKNSKSFSFSKSVKNISAVYIFNLMTMKSKKVSRDINDLSRYSWSPDNTYMVYSGFRKKDMGKSFKYISNIPDRSRFGSYENSLYIYFPAGNVLHKLSGFDKDYGDFLISPDSNKILLISNEPDAKHRPYFLSGFLLLDVKSLKTKKLFESNFANPVSWSPDSEKILFGGGPSSFNGIGRSVDLGQDTVPNEYDNQLYIYDLSTGKTTAITKFFAPSVQNAVWNIRDNAIYIQAEDRSYIKFYRYDPLRKKISNIKTPVDVIGSIDVASTGSTAVLWGSGSTLPYKLYKVDLKRKRTSLLRDYNRKDFKGVKFGKLEDWNYRKSNGHEIIGRLYYPVDFDSAKKYPCIVYYYGGTSPVERSFGGRYPFNWYAANGYMVYVLQPSGATGFGQKFSAVHVNDWGDTTSKEIIGATKELLRTHLFIDPKRVGAMGASYGGFLTEYLATQTDIFSAFISHAGISALSSYWGVGDWGYTYSGIATANSFPWNRKDIYVGHSPLFMADRINTPLLLLHGDIDNNVPTGESYQMFLALKLLGKEVALVTFDGQSHWILEYGKRVRWMKTIIAWFDKWLKKEPLYWNSLYGKYEK